MLNNVTLIGRLTKDLELRQSGGGMPYTYFTVACDRFGTDGADFIQCVAFGKTAENMTKFIGKGSQIAVDGRIQSNNFKRDDGTTNYSMNVVANRVVFLDSRSSNQAPRPQQASSAPRPQQTVSINETLRGNEFASESVSFNTNKKESSDDQINYDDIPWED